MNILIEGGNLNSIAEGTRNVAISYAEKFRKRGHNVIIITKQIDRIRRKKYKKFEIINGIKFYRWFNYSDKFYKWVEKGKKSYRIFYNFLKGTNSLEFYLTYKQIIKKEKIDIIQVFVKGLRPKFYYQALKFLSKKPVVLTLLGDPSFNYIRYNPKKAFEGTDLILVTSKTIYNNLKSSNTPNIIYLSYGIDVNRFKSGNISKEKKVKEIFFSRYPSENLLDIVKSIKRINKERKVKIMFNKGAEEIFSKNDIHKDYLKGISISYVGHLKKIEDLFKRVDLVIDLHRKNKYLTCASPPAKILEAMACGTPVLSTDIPEIREIIKDNENGFLVKDNSTEQVYNKVKQALSSKKDVGKKARETIEKKFNLDKSIEKYEKIYNDLMNKK